MFEPDLQDALRSQGLDGWLIYDFRGSNPVLAHFAPQARWTTRRVWMLIRRDGSPVVLVHFIDAPQFASLDAEVRVFRGREDMLRELSRLVGGLQRLAMEYSPMNELPVVSKVDAGAVELVRSFGAEVVSSADLMQRTLARWTEDALRAHQEAQQVTTRIKDDAFALVRTRLRAGDPLREGDVRDFILAGFAQAGLDPDHPPIVGVNEHSGDPHYEVPATGGAPIRRGDWLLIDLWARHPGDHHVFTDITWTAQCGGQVPGERRHAFEAVRDARIACFKLAVDSFRSGHPATGAELDEAARGVLQSRGYADYIRHRTGHSLSPGGNIHGVGMNLDALETRDFRRITAGTGFTIEPGVYLPGFGVRNEIDVYVDPVSGPRVTSCQQDELLVLD
jgi:Xaa-Pro aminopeptidase